MKRFVLATLTASTLAIAGPTPPMEPDIPASFTAPKAAADFAKREVMVPMRDGVKLKTFILVPKGAKRAPIILNRTPYDASKRAGRAPSNRLEGVVPIGVDTLARAGYILVFQDIRGKHGSEGDYVMTRPLSGPLNGTKIDHATDAYDTIEWLVKNVSETNGKVGMMGSSYEGFTVLMALAAPHPALKAAMPMCPMVDGWRGDDWFHNGAFRQINMGYFIGQTTKRGNGDDVSNGHYDDFEAFRRAGSAAGYAKLLGLDQLPYWKKLTEHPAYDAYWQQQALDKILAKVPLTVPTMFVTAIYDQEDSYGGIAAYLVREALDKANDKNFLVLGPWRHSGMNYDGRTHGPLDFGTDTAAEFRRDVMRPFFDARLKDGAPAYSPPPVFAYETGTQAWKKLASWPPGPTKTKFYLDGFTSKATADFDEYVADPAKPVPYIPRPVRFADRPAWQWWLSSDQRFIADRPDVLVYQTDVLTKPVKITGAPIAHLFASTTGTDADWVVKLIDVYPDEVPAAPHLGGYQLPISMEIFRGRYRKSLEAPSALTPGAVEHYTIALPHANHVFQPGHRIMVQIQSSWFPLYDRNPQKFVPNIFFAAPGDYQKATQRIYRKGQTASYLELPIGK
jgi:putative CocE/NonD family hydrolase